MYRIGELAKLCDVNADTLRFYEKHGLLTPSARSDSGYRLYSRDDAARLRFIMRAKSVGFSLNEITELLSIELNKADWACADVKGMVDSKLVQINARIAELQLFSDSLKQLSDACCGGPESAEFCSILEALENNQQVETGRHQGHSATQKKVKTHVAE